MRILLTHVVIGRGGDAIQWEALAAAFRAAGHDVMGVGVNAVTPYGVRSATARARSIARRFPWWLRDALEVSLTPIALVRAWRAARGGVDLIVHRAGPYELLGPVLARLLRVPMVGYLDTHVPVERRYRAESYWRAAHERTMRWLGREAILLVTPSTPVRDYYRSLGIPAQKLTIQHNAVFERHLHMGAEAARRVPPLSAPGHCTLGFVGSLSDWHRVDVLLQALALLVRGRERAYRLVVIGAGREDARLKTLAARLGVAPHVEWRGPMPHDRAVEVMAEFDIAVLPGTLPIGAPMKLAEYAAMCRPIVAPNLSNIAELLSPGKEAILVEPENAEALVEAIVGLVQDPERARRIGRAAHARMRASTWEGLALRLLDAAAGGRRPDGVDPGRRPASSVEAASATRALREIHHE